MTYVCQSEATNLDILLKTARIPQRSSLMPHLRRVMGGQEALNLNIWPHHSFCLVIRKFFYLFCFFLFKQIYKPLFFYCMRTMPVTTNTNIVAKFWAKTRTKTFDPTVTNCTNTAVTFPSSISSHTSDEKTRGQIRANRK